MNHSQNQGIPKENQIVIWLDEFIVQHWNNKGDSERFDQNIKNFFLYFEEQLRNKTCQRLLEIHQNATNKIPFGKVTNLDDIKAIIWNLDQNTVLLKPFTKENVMKCFREAFPSVAEKREKTTADNKKGKIGDTCSSLLDFEDDELSGQESGLNTVPLGVKKPTTKPLDGHPSNENNNLKHAPTATEQPSPSSSSSSSTSIEKTRTMALLSTQTTKRVCSTLTFLAGCASVALLICFATTPVAIGGSIAAVVLTAAMIKLFDVIYKMNAEKLFQHPPLNIV